LANNYLKPTINKGHGRIERNQNNNNPQLIFTGAEASYREAG